MEIKHKRKCVPVKKLGNRARQIEPRYILAKLIAAAFQDRGHTLEVMAANHFTIDLPSDFEALRPNGASDIIRISLFNLQNTCDFSCLSRLPKCPTLPVCATEGRTVLLFVAAWYEPCAQISQVLRALANDHATIRFVQVRACVFVARGQAAHGRCRMVL